MKKARRDGPVTHALLIKHGLRFASERGLAGVSIAPLAERSGIRKSSFFAHFQTKESLQIGLLNAAAELFRDHVLVKAGNERHGVARLRLLFELWLDWPQHAGMSGDLFVAASTELDDMPGPVRNHLVALQEIWIQSLVGFVHDAIADGGLAADTDPKQVAFEIAGIYLAFHTTSRLLRDGSARTRALHALERLLGRPARRTKAPVRRTVRKTRR
jgi:AcrR family transcriptional regulator